MHRRERSFCFWPRGGEGDVSAEAKALSEWPAPQVGGSGRLFMLSGCICGLEWRSGKMEEGNSQGCEPLAVESR